MVEFRPSALVNRREFSAAFLAALSAVPLRADIRIPVAVQLFSLRRQCENDLEGTLAYVRKVGYEGVELAGFYGRTASQWHALLEKNALKCCGSHTPLDQLTGDHLQTTIENNQALENRRLIIPGLPRQYEESVAGWKAAAEVLNDIAAKLQPAGMRVGYHNHDVEFRSLDGALPWAVLFEHTRPEVILQLDIGNARVAGADPAGLIRQYPGRAVTVHVKDYLPGHLDPVIGSSKFDWREFAETCRSRGATEWFIIEHDSPDREEAKICFDRFQRLRASTE